VKRSGERIVKTLSSTGVKKAAFLALYCKPTSVGAMIAGFEIRFEMYGLLLLYDTK
jgi:hypothetical protein